MIPEAVVAMLACARIGAPHSVVFGGFSAEALRTASTTPRQGASSPPTAVARRRSSRSSPSSTRRSPRARRRRARARRASARGTTSRWTEGRDVWWHDVVAASPRVHPREAIDAEHPLFILYTSGTTGKPKGILHTTGGYLTQVAYTHKHVFDLKPDTDVYWCTADVGWVTGHSYIVYGPLANGATR
jgi:acetyl-CoA synthetase